MRALFTISLLELFLGGGGRLTAVGPVSMRMALFAACLCAALVAVLFPRRRSDGVLLSMLLVLTYLLVHVAGLVVGAIHGADPAEMFSEFQQSLYWLAAPLFALMIQSEPDVQRYARLVQMAGVTLAVTYLAILLGLLSGAIYIGSMRAIFSNSGEISFRSGSFFIYKGFLYLGISIVFFFAMRGRYWKSLVLLVGIALTLSFTRGFVVSTAAGVLLMFFIQGRWRLALPVMLLLGGAAFLIWIYLPSLNPALLASHEISTNQRVEDMTYMLYHATAKTFIFGEGYGSLINDRFQSENTFLWALWKLGTIGLVFWMLPLFLCVYYYLKIANRRSNSLANAYLFGTVLVYVQTLTNPFLNNPIGLSFVMLALFSLRILSRGEWNPAVHGVATSIEKPTNGLR